MKFLNNKSPLHAFGFHYFLIIAGVLFLYARTVQFGFVYFDDSLLILDNYDFVGKLSNIPRAFVQDVFRGNQLFHEHRNYYRPLLTLSLMFDAQIGGIKPAMYHISNILYHLVACLLLFTFLKQQNIRRSSALLLTLLFSFHPLLNQAVAWIPGRNDSLLTVFVLSCFIFLKRYLDSKKYTSLLLHVLFFALALFTKENAIMIVPLACYFVFLGNRQTNENTRFAVQLGTGYVVVMVIWFFLRRTALFGSVDEVSIHSTMTSIFNNRSLYFQYIGKTVLPYNLSVMSTTKDTNYYVGSFVIALFVVCLYFSKHKNMRLVLFGLFWFLLFLTPSLIATTFGGMEHRMYLPVVGLVVIAGNIDFVSQLDRTKKTNIAVLLAVLVILFMISFTRLPIFSTSNSFWESAVETSPHSAIGNLYLGKNYANAGNYYKAIEVYKSGIDRDSTEKMLFNNLGSAYLSIGDYKHAGIYLMKEIKQHPDNPYPYINLGIVYENEKHMNKAATYYEQAIKINPHADKVPYEALCDYYKAANDTPKYTYYFNQMRSYFK